MGVELVDQGVEPTIPRQLSRDALHRRGVVAEVAPGSPVVAPAGVGEA